MNEILHFLMGILVISMFLCFFRLLRGPSIPDRVVALDQIGIHVVGIIALYSLTVNKNILLDIIMVTALLAFLGTISFARYLEQGAS